LDAVTHNKLLEYIFVFLWTKLKHK